MVWFDKNSALKQKTLDILEGVAIEYGQESIAWSVSVTEFVEGIA